MRSPLWLLGAHWAGKEAWSCRMLLGPPAGSPGGPTFLFFFTSFFKKIFIYLFGCTGTFSCGMWDLVP